MKLSNMKKSIAYIGLGLVFGCQVLQTTSLPEDKALVHFTADTTQSNSIAVKEFKNGVLDDFNDISRWNISHANAIGIDSKEGAMRIFTTGMGPNWEEFSIEYAPLNFSETKIIVLRAKTDTWQVPIIRLDLVDKAGRMTNAKPQKIKVAPNMGYQEYVFRYDNAFRQNWPSKDIVDSTQIVKLRFNVNGGMEPYTGTLFFENMKVVDKYPQ